MPAVLPGRFFSDSALYELPPIRVPGTGYTLRTGTGWADDGTTISSSTPGDRLPIKPEFMEQFWELEIRPGTNVVEISLNGSEFKAMPLDPNGL